jgi:flagellar operon protein
MGQEFDLLRRLEPVVRPAGSPAPAAAPRKPVEERGFEELLRDAAQISAGEASPLRFSAHARQRLAERGVELTDRQIHALSSAASEAQAKGARDALMLMNRLGLIVNLPNRTVLTVLPEDRMRSGVVTQIDSTVIVDDPAATSPGSP